MRFLTPKATVIGCTGKADTNSRLYVCVSCPVLIYPCFHLPFLNLPNGAPVRNSLHTNLTAPAFFRYAFCKEVERGRRKDLTSITNSPPGWSRSQGFDENSLMSPGLTSHPTHEIEEERPMKVTEACLCPFTC